ncbi:hypothetical protein AC249_AIPGENE28318 [Exaiptasia diaphana]|nr:hypothetical protein AC249_AIPGENE28318 [Exaiptasia diaphana]
MDAYHKMGHQGWRDILHVVKEKIETSGLNSRIVDYYLEGEDSISVRRIKRIVREQLKKQAEEYRAFKTTSEGKATKSNVKEKKRTPDEKMKDKLRFFVASDSDSSLSDLKVEQEITGSSKIGKREIPDKIMRYANKMVPEDRKKRKIVEYAVSSESDSQEDQEEKKPARKNQNLRQASFEAQIAHTRMCEQAGMAMGRMANVLDKLEKKIDDM